MRIQTLFFSLILSFFSLAAIAGSDHDHGHSHEPVSQIQAEENAIKNVARLADKGKIDKSWKTSQAMKTEKKKFGKNMEWVVTFNNKTINDSAKQTLYIFLSLGGEYLAANYTGK
ncbi:MAG: hypothetical protein COB30_002865 [Ectothiorhodospiraceae bacterium]|nr:hypothetical protein [Ectothiorhodospiraceae bacterium]